MNRLGRVFLVGAGPGDPELLTLKAVRLIGRAEAVVYDRLVSPEVLALAPATARRISVGKAPKRHPVPQDRINDLLVSLAQEGLTVVRLKGGDPFIFGRGSEEVECLKAAGIPFEVAPGVTAAQGCAAATAVPLTHRGLATGVRYIAGLFGEDGMTALDLWQNPPAPRRILAGYGRGEEKLPVYKMPHLEGWALAGERFVLPAVGRHEVLWVDARSLEEVGRTATHGQPVFAVARPDGRQVWVNFAHPLNDTVQVIDTQSGEVVHEFKPGPAVLHMEFTPRGHEVWVSVRDAGRIDVYDASSFEKLAEIPAESPSGIFFTARAHRTGL